MNSDETPRLPPASPPRSAPSKSRWNRGPRPGAPAGRPAPGPVCGEVSDLATARESLSGSLAHGPAQPAPEPAPEEKPRAPRPVAEPQPAPATRPASTQAELELPTDKAVARPLETSRYHNPTPPRSLAARAEPAAEVEAAPKVEPAPPVDRAPRHSPSSTAESTRRPERQQPPTTPAASEPPAHPRRSHHAPATRDESSPRPEAPRPAPRREPAHDGQGRREHYIALLPDPANDPMPRRLRTEKATPAPVQEYSPSAGRAPHKSIPAKVGRHPGHADASAHRPKAHASIPTGRAAKVAKASTEPDDTAEVDVPKREGLLGKLKRFFGLDKVGHGPPLKSTAVKPVVETKAHESPRGEPTHESHGGHSGRRRRRRGGRGRSDPSRGPSNH